MEQKDNQFYLSFITFLVLLFFKAVMLALKTITMTTNFLRSSTILINPAAVRITAFSRQSMRFQRCAFAENCTRPQHRVCGVFLLSHLNAQECWRKHHYSHLHMRTECESRQPFLNALSISSPKLHNFVTKASSSTISKLQRHVVQDLKKC